MSYKSLFILPFLLLAACYSSTTEATARSRIETVSTATTHYYRQPVDIRYDEPNGQISLRFDDIDVILDLIDYESYLSFRRDKVSYNKQSSVNFNYIYDIDIPDAIKRIKLFRAPHTDAGLLVLPSATEEYPTFNVLKFNNFGVHHTYLIEVQQFDCENFDTLSLNKKAKQKIVISQKGKHCQSEVHEETQIK